MIIVLQVLALLVLMFIMASILNLGMYLVANKLGWFEPSPIIERWYHPYIDKIQFRLWKRLDLLDRDVVES